MAIQIKGRIESPAGSVASRVAGPGVVMLSGRKISYKTDGTAEGSVKWECDEANISELPKLGSPHPDDFALECHHIEGVASTLGKVAVECFYHGITATYGSLSRPTIDYAGGTDTIPIQCHPQFADFAGTPSSPKNGALWVDPETQKKSENNASAEFFGFVDPANREFFGVEYFYVNRPLVSRTVWSKNRPSLKKGMTIVNSIPGFTSPPGIVNWLLLDTPYRQIGNYYQTTEQYKGSPAPGWSKKIYPQ